MKKIWQNAGLALILAIGCIFTVGCRDTASFSVETSARYVAEPSTFAGTYDDVMRLFKNHDEKPDKLISLVFANDGTTPANAHRLAEIQAAVENQANKINLNLSDMPEAQDCNIVKNKEYLAGLLNTPQIQDLTLGNLNLPPEATIAAINDEIAKLQKQIADKEQERDKEYANMISLQKEAIDEIKKENENIPKIKTMCEELGTKHTIATILSSSLELLDGHEADAVKDARDALRNRVSELLDGISALTANETTKQALANADKHIKESEGAITSLSETLNTCNAELEKYKTTVAANMNDSSFSGKTNEELLKEYNEKISAWYYLTDLARQKGKGLGISFIDNVIATKSADPNSSTSTTNKSFVNMSVGGGYAMPQESDGLKILMKLRDANAASN